jgi:hypothetical protein
MNATLPRVALHLLLDSLLRHAPHRSVPQSVSKFLSSFSNA